MQVISLCDSIEGGAHVTRSWEIFERVMAGKNASTGWGLEDGTSGVLRSIAFATNYAH